MRGALEIAAAVREGRSSASEALEESLEAISARDPRIRAFVQVQADRARQRARDVDRAVERGEEPGPLAGVPVALKANITARGLETSCCSRILEGWIPPYDATAVRRLEEAGAVIVGNTNMDEFAMGSSTEHSALHPTRNPVDPQRVPGGSSGGSAAAVAGGMVPLSLGSDTAGSVRQPAAFCGVVGLKPTYGLVSRYGLVAFASSLDQIGPMATSVDDAFAALRVLAGRDSLDSTSLDVPGGHFGFLDAGRQAALESARSLRIGLPIEAFSAGVDGEVRRCVSDAVEAVARLGADVREVSLPTLEHTLAAYHIISPAECSSNLARFDGVRYGPREPAGDLQTLYRSTRGRGFGPEVKRRIMVGTYVLSHGYYEAYYLKAQQVRTLVIQDHARAFEEVDVLVLPTAPSAPFRLGEKKDDPLAMYMSDTLTAGANMAGIPALSLPCGTTGDGLPVGIQVQGPVCGEGRVYRAAVLIEEALG